MSTASVATLRRFLLPSILVAGLMGVLAPAASPGEGRPRRDPSQILPRPVAAGAEARSSEPFFATRKPTVHRRPEWWPGAMGPRLFGHVTPGISCDRDSLVLPGGKGVLNVHQRHPRVPGGLRWRPHEEGRAGRVAWIVQLAPSLTTGRSNAEVRRALAAMAPSLRILDYVPHGGYLVRVAPDEAGALAGSPLLRFAAPYHPAYRIAPDLGLRPLRSAARAADPVLDLVIRLFPGEPAAETEEEILSSGGRITFRRDVGGAGPVLGARLHRDEVFSLARRSEVRWIEERRDRESFSLVTSLQTEMGRLLDPRIEGKFVRPFTEEGIDGGGVYTTDPNQGCPPFDPDTGDVSPGCFTVPPQFIGLVDNGISLDAAPLAHSRTAACTAAGAACAGLASGTGVGGGHRKVEAYLRSWDLDGDGVAEDATAEGDFLSCDDVASGGSTHGHNVAASMLGNPSEGRFGLEFTFSDADPPDPNGGLWNDQHESALPMDGQASGARLIFIDAQGNGTPVAGPPACATNLMSDVEAGVLVVDDVEALAYRRDLDPNAATLHPRGAGVVVLPFGTSASFNPDFGGFPSTSYTPDAGDLDRLLFSMRELTVVVPVGNAGHLNEAQFDPNAFPVFPLLIQDLATGKNTIPVGANHADSLDRSVSAIDPSEFMAPFSTQGPATISSLRTGPLLVAPGAEMIPQDASREGSRRDDFFASHAVIQSLDSDQDASGGMGTARHQSRWGTSLSAAKVAGAAAQTRDYFAQGFYPRGEKSSGPAVSGMSGMLVKALLTASTDWVSGGLTSACVNRPCFQQGFGKVELANVLPLRSYPEARRPADGSDGPYPPGVPATLSVVDETWDGGLAGRRVSDPNVAHGFGVIALGETLEYRFTVDHGGSSVRAALAWFDAESDVLINNLDLEVIDGDYDRTEGWDTAFGTPSPGTGMCNSAAFGGGFPSSCGFCTIDGLDNPDAVWFDPNGTNPHVRRFLGSRMLDRNQFSRFATCTSGNCDLNDTLGDGICDLSVGDGSGVCDVPENVCTASSDPNEIGTFCLTSAACDAPNPDFETCVAGDPNLIGTTCAADADCHSLNPFFQTCISGSVGRACTSDAACAGLDDFQVESQRDTTNTTEMVHVYHSSGYGTLSDTRGALSEGFYKVVVSFPDRPSVIELGAPDVPCIHAGDDGQIDPSTTVGGNDHVTTSPDGEVFVVSGTDDPNTAGVDEARCDSVPGSGDDILLVPAGGIAQPFGLVLTGAISHDGRPGTSLIDLDRADYDCADAEVVVQVTENETSSQADYTGDVAAGTVLRVLDSSGAVVDQESGFVFTAGTGTTGQGIFKAYEEMFHRSEPVRLVSAEAAGRAPIPANGMLEVRDGDRLEASYTDPQEPADTVATSATVTCSSPLTPALMALDLRNARDRLVAGGCDASELRGGRGDLYMDAGERVQYQVFFANQSATELRELEATLSCHDPSGTSAQPCQHVLILDPVQSLGRVPFGREGAAAWNLEILPAVTSLPTAERVVEMVVSFTSANPEHGASGPGAQFVFREALQADTERLFYGTDHPAGGRVLVDHNRSGTVERRDRGDGTPREEREILEFQPWAGTANAGLLTACGGQPCVPFDFDLSDGAFSSGLSGDSRPGPAFPLATQGWSYGTGGACGWQTQDPAGGPSAARGIWHAGQGPVGAFGTGCGLYAVPSDITTEGEEFTRYLLRSPIFHKVNTATDARGFPWELRMESLSWNAGEDLADALASMEVEIDTDIDDDGPVILGDSFTYRPALTLSGPLTGIADGARRFGPLFDPDGSMSGASPAPTGDEVGVSDPLGRYGAADYLARHLMAFPVEDTDPNDTNFTDGESVSDGLNCPPVPPGESCRAGGFSTRAGPVRNRELDTGGFYEEVHGTAGERFQFEYSWVVREGAAPATGITVDDVAFVWSEEHPGDQEGFTGGDCSLDNLAGVTCTAGSCAGPGQGGEPCATVEDCRKVVAEGICSGSVCTAGRVGGSCAVDNDCDLGLCLAGNTELACLADADCDLATNSCDAIGLRVAHDGGPGTPVSTAACATVGLESLFLYDCSGSLGVTVQDLTPALCGPATDIDGDGTPDGCTTAPRQVLVTLRSDAQAAGIPVRLTEEIPSGGLFTGEASLSALQQQPGVLFVAADAGQSPSVVASYEDPECDQDADGVLGESTRGDVDGDQVPDAGADGVPGEAHPFLVFVGGASASDDDSCFEPVTGTDIPNPAGTAQMDLNGDRIIDAADCVVDPNHNLTGQCDWDSDGVGDLCDNCPRTANHDQVDSDGTGIGDLCESFDIDGDGVPDDADGNPATSNPCDPDPNGSFSSCDDNCPAIYNPSQSTSPSGAGTGRGELCDRSTDFDGDGVDERDDNCPNEGLMEDGSGGLTPGPCPGGATGCTYNPDQADTDGDGVGDPCDGDDFDDDGVVDLIDSCPTVYNPADPVIGFQTDGDHDGLGDDRAGQDPLGGCVGGPVPGRACLPAGTAADCGAGGFCVASSDPYCDPDSLDDDRDGLVDDLVTFTSRITCDYSPGGLGARPAELGEFRLAGVILTDDGTADFICVAGDPDPNNSPGVIEGCPIQDSGPTGDAACDTAGGPGGDGDCEPVPDGTPDPGESVFVDLTLENLTVDAAGQFRSIENASLGIRALSPSIGCITRGEVFVGTIPAGTIAAGGGIQTPPQTLAFVVDPAQGQSLSLAAPNTAKLGIAVTGDGISTSTVDAIVSVSLDRDLFLQSAIPSGCGTPTSGSALGAAHGAPGVLCEDFDTDRNSSGQVEFHRLFPSVSPSDPLLAVHDPNDDILGHAIDGGTIPTGVEGSICSTDTGFAAAQLTCHVVRSENDWHLHSPFEGCDTDDSYDGGDPQFASSCAPDLRAHSGFRSLHLGRHLNATNTIWDTYRMRQTSAFVMDPVFPGTASELEFWQIIRVCDDLCAAGGDGSTHAGGQIQLSVKSLETGLFEPWQRLDATENPYGSYDQEVVIVCEFDPTDDSQPPLDETMCGGPPESQWSEQGDIYGTDRTTCNSSGDTETHGFGGTNPNGDCGQTTNRTVDPGCSWVADPNCGSFLEHGSQGLGVWARTVFDLTPWVGREARLRWIFQGGGGWGFGESRSFLEPEAGFSPYQSFERDAGWYVDDIKLTDLRTGGGLRLDPDTGTATCPVQGDPDNCGVITARIAGAVTDPASGMDLLFAEDQVAGAPMLLHALTSTAGDDPNTPGQVEGACLGGLLEYEWSELDEATGAESRLLSSFSPRGSIEVLPSGDTTYRVTVRCTSDPACVGTAEARLLTYTGEGNDIASAGTGMAPGEGYRGLYADHDPVGGATTLSWEARPQPPGIDGWDLFRSDPAPPGGDLFAGDQFLGVPFDPDGPGGLAGSCNIPNGAPGDRVSFQDLNALPAGQHRLYMLSHSSLNALALAPLGERPDGSSRAGTLVTTSSACP